MDIREHSIFISWEVGEGGRVEGFGGNHIIFQGGCSKDQLCPTEYKVGTTEN